MKYVHSDCGVSYGVAEPMPGMPFSSVAGLSTSWSIKRRNWSDAPLGSEPVVPLVPASTCARAMSSDAQTIALTTAMTKTTRIDEPPE